MLGVDDGVVEGPEPVVELPVAGGELVALVVEALEAGLEPGDLVAGEVEADGAQLRDDAAVPFRGVGLALEGAQLAPDLAQQVLEAQQVRLRWRRGAVRRLLLAAAELEDPGGLLDDRAPVGRGGR